MTIAHKHLWLTVVWTLCLFTSCHSGWLYDDGTGDPEDTGPVCHCTLLLSLNEGTFSNLTRSGSTESELNTLWLFVVDAPVGSTTEDWSTVKRIAVPADQLQKDEKKQLLIANVQFTGGVGPKHLYIGANLSTELIASFCSGNSYYTAPATESYEEVMAHFTDADKGVAMFCDEPFTFVITGNTAEGAEGSQSNPFKKEVSLSRMVAKVLLACEMRSSDPTSTDYGYAKTTTRSADMLADATQREKYAGWCPLSEIRYKLQAVNRASYFVQQRNELDSVVDPNYAVADQLTWDGTAAHYRTPYDAHFVYLDGTEAQNRFPASGTADYCQAALRYDPTRIPTDTYTPTSPYTEGLYCPENTCDNDWTALCSPLTDDRLTFWRAAPEHVVTSLIVEARFTPAVIYTEAVAAAGTAPELFESEVEARDKLTEESHTPDDGLATFYAIDGKYCYTYLGMQAELKRQAALTASERDPVSSAAANYQEFPDGRCYFHDYMNALSEHTFLGLERNRYYILHCTRLNVPTSLDAPLEIVRAGIEWKDWVEAGSNDNTAIEPDLTD